MQNSTKMNELELIKGLHEKIEVAFSVQFSVKTETRVFQDDRNYEGCKDLAVLPKAKEGNAGADAPLCVVEVGLSSGDWWKKCDQGQAYLQTLQQKPDELLCFNKPMLTAIITLDDSSPDVHIRMGVFLCTPRNEEKVFRMSLICTNSILPWTTLQSHLDFCYGFWIISRHREVKNTRRSPNTSARTASRRETR